MSNPARYCWGIESLHSKPDKYTWDEFNRLDAEWLMPFQNWFGSTEKFDEVLLAEYNKLEKISVDYAIMEKAENIVSAVGNFGWDDVGTWISAGEHFPEDADGNRVYGDAVIVDSEDNVVVNCQEDHLVGVMGLEDVVVVHTPDATLVASKTAVPELKKLVREVGSKGEFKKYI